MPANAPPRHGRARSIDERDAIAILEGSRDRSHDRKLIGPRTVTCMISVSYTHLRAHETGAYL
eukprot:4026711-Pyramimonas_sp.AAC.1